MAKLNKSKFAILGVLGDGPASGYDIKQFSDMSISHFWNENYGHIYPVLKRLEREKLVTMDSRQKDGRLRSVYSITQKGREALNSWLAEPSADTPRRFEFLLKLFFGHDLPVSHWEKALEAEKQNAAEELREYRAIEEKFAAKRPACGKKSDPFRMATLKFGIKYAQARIEWCDETLKMILQNAGNKRRIE
jgi:DNA-binding PadR family transcriptional regulator